VVENYTDQSATYDFLLTLHVNHRPFSYRFRHKRRFQSKIAIFPPFVYLTPPVEWVPLKLGNCAWLISYNDEATWSRNKFVDILICLDAIQECDRRIDRHRPTANTALTHVRHRRQTARRICAICNGVADPMPICVTMLNLVVMCQRCTQK